MTAAHTPLHVCRFDGQRYFSLAARCLSRTASSAKRESTSVLSRWCVGESLEREDGHHEVSNVSAFISTACAPETEQRHAQTTNIGGGAIVRVCVCKVCSVLTNVLAVHSSRRKQKRKGGHFAGDRTLTCNAQNPQESKDSHEARWCYTLNASAKHTGCQSGIFLFRQGVTTRHCLRASHADYSS